MGKDIGFYWILTKLNVRCIEDRYYLYIVCEGTNCLEEVKLSKFHQTRRVLRFEMRNYMFMSAHDLFS